MKIVGIGRRFRSSASDSLAHADVRSLLTMQLPSPVRLLDGIGERASLWMKDDSHLHQVYGGNKCRKLAHILRRTVGRGKNTVVTFGAAGSHHVLATGLFAQEFGLSARAFLIPQPWSEHAQAVLCSSVECGIDLVPATLSIRACAAAARACFPNCDIIAPGGSNVCGSMGYFEAALELAEQIRAGLLPEPDIIVVAFGSAGTAAGLWAGITHAGLNTSIMGVSVIGTRGRVLYARRIANALLRLVGSNARLDNSRFAADSRWLGEGYGFESDVTRTALDVGDSLDLPLDPTYTAKAFAGALALVASKRIGSIDAIRWPTRSLPGRNVLYWHTLSAMKPQWSSLVASSIPKNIGSLLR